MWRFWYGLGWSLAVTGMVISLPGSLLLLGAMWCEQRAAELRGDADEDQTNEQG